MNPVVIGLDLGTSGVRAVAMTADAEVVAQAAVPMAPPRRDGSAVSQSASVWADAVDACLSELHRTLDHTCVRAIAVDGTSGTVLLTDALGTPVADALMYNDARAVDEARRIATIAPPESAAHGASSALARLLYLQALHADDKAVHLLHQADWIAGRLLGRYGDSDENNALKTGYDPIARAWPAWFDALGVRHEWLPRVHPPGTPLGSVSQETAAQYGWRADTQVHAGTTDGVAAFLATGAGEVGDAVTSLGTTLVVKLLSDRPLFAPDFGIYSHRLGDQWLAGGASNAGGAALLAHFSAERMAELTPLLQPDTPTGLDYYPLPGIGERFPLNDPKQQARTTPRPGDDARFFQGLLEGLAAIERLAFLRLKELGAPALRSVRSVGGGAKNPAYSRIRERALAVAMPAPLHTEAACGAAMLARRALPKTPKD